MRSPLGHRPRGRLLRSGALAAAAGCGAFLLMADDGRLGAGVPLGAALSLACTWAVLDLLGAVARPGAATGPAAEVAARDAARAAAGAALGAALTVSALACAVHAILPQAVAGALLTAGVVATAAGLFALGVALGPLRTDEEGRPRPLLARHGFWLWTAMAVLYLPALGAGSLTDPWETHYGEVAREVLARDDWISLWWSWEGFFYSKPVLGIWMQSIAMATLGVHVAPGQMLLGVSGHLAHPEWAVRAPFALSAMIGVYLLYKGVARWLGRRAAVLGAVVLATSPHWFLVAHQSMTDMPFVAALAAAVGLVMLGAREDAQTLARSYALSWRGRTVVFGLWQLVLGGALLCVLPQILCLASRNVELVLHGAGPYGFHPHPDEVRAGSGLGNCRQPGDPPCATHAPFGHFEPWLQALLWTALLALWLAATWRERRCKRLLYLAAWLFAALATMAKGPAGAVIPAGCVLVWIAATRRWRELLHLQVVVGPLLVALIVGPWFLAALVRHGTPFTDELIFHDMYSRAFGHVHDTNGAADTSFVYYVQQLGYGLFPWTALAGTGLFAAGSLAPRSSEDARDAAALLLVWFLLAFALFAAMGTKFHHYILPAVPPAAMLAGLVLDHAIDSAGDATSARRALSGAAALAGALVVALVAADLVHVGDGGHVEGPAHLMWLFTYRYDRRWPAALDLRGPIAAVACLAALLCVASAVAPRISRRAIVGAWVVLGLVWAAWGLDVYLPAASPHWGQRAIFEAYYQQRAGPEEPIAAYQMNWKGENFYSGNRIAQFGAPTVPAGTPSFAEWVRGLRAQGTKTLYVVTEWGRVGSVRGDLKPSEVREVTTASDCGQFVLLRAEL